NHKSLNYAFLQDVMKGCQENPAIDEIQLLDLYEDEFFPRLIFHERKRGRDMYRDPQLEKYRQQLTWADQIVFVYPIWWGRPPVMLL
uniref:NAD(P)H-dependent oxidoreductase n=1 Tax=Lysinibacillus sp. D4B1_S16 TaxID=2941231 RepID=UPI0020BF3C17